MPVVSPTQCYDMYDIWCGISANTHTQAYLGGCPFGGGALRIPNRSVDILVQQGYAAPLLLRVLLLGVHAHVLGYTAQRSCIRYDHQRLPPPRSWSSHTQGLSPAHPAVPLNTNPQGQRPAATFTSQQTRQGLGSVVVCLWILAGQPPHPIHITGNSTACHPIPQGPAVISIPRVIPWALDLYGLPLGPPGPPRLIFPYPTPSGYWREGWGCPLVVNHCLCQNQQSSPFYHCSAYKCTYIALFIYTVNALDAFYV